MESNHAKPIHDGVPTPAMSNAGGQPAAPSSASPAQSHGSPKNINLKPGPAASASRATEQRGRFDFQPQRRWTGALGAGAGVEKQPRFVEPDYDRLRELASLYDKPYRKTLRPSYRLLLTLVAFVVGASAGLGAAWWFATSSDARPPAAGASVPGLPSLKIDGQQTAAAPPEGISVSELPYDGAGGMPSHQASAPKSNPEELPYAGALPAGAEPSARIARDAAEDVAQDAGVETAASDAAVVKKKTARNRERERAVSPVKRPDANEAKEAPRKTVKAAQRYRGQRNVKDREFDRIRRQADEELKKKPEHKRNLAGGRPSTRPFLNQSTAREELLRKSDRNAKTRVMLARCQRVGNLIQREQCKWQLCRGMWGKNGCPSYAHAASY